MIDLEAGWLGETQRILAAHVPDCEVRAFGSRVSGGAQRYSDLDLVLIAGQPLEPGRLEALRDALSGSNLPILVDVVDWYALPAPFRTAIEASSEQVQAAQQAR